MAKIIAEIASSHNGDIELGKRMIRAAASAGVDIVKFQSWQAKNVAPSDPDKERYEKLQLSDEAHRILKQECERNGVEFLTTCFDVERIPFLKSLGLKRVKVASFDLKNEPLLKALRKDFDEVIVSTGQSTEEEVAKAAEILSTRKKFALLHCVSIYPCPPEKANLDRMGWLRRHAEVVGYSDHVPGPEAAMLAIGMGAAYVEKHFTLDRNMEQPAHTASAKKGAKPTTTHMMADEPDVFKRICDFNRMAAILRGTGKPTMDPEESFHRQKYTGRLDGSWRK